MFDTHPLDWFTTTLAGLLVLILIIVLVISVIAWMTVWHLAQNYQRALGSLPEQYTGFLCIQSFDARTRIIAASSKGIVLFKLRRSKLYTIRSWDWQTITVEKGSASTGMVSFDGLNIKPMKGREFAFLLYESNTLNRQMAGSALDSAIRSLNERRPRYAAP